VSIGKINKKKLSRKFRLKHAPLKVLPLTTSAGRRRVLKKDSTEQACQTKQIPSSPLLPTQRSSIQCSLEEAVPSSLRYAKKQGRRKAPLTFHPFVSTRMKMNALRWIFLFAIIILAVGVLFIMLEDGIGSMKNIIIYGAMGFITFFMGYFGTLIAKDVIDLILEKKDSRNDADVDA
jgi:hypothetical protein